MRNTTEIKKQHDQVQKKTDELTAELQALETEIEKLQERFVAGSIKSDKLQAARLQKTALEASINSLTAESERLEAELAEAELAENKEVWLNRLKNTAEDASKHLKSVFEIRAEFDEIISEFAERLLSARTAFIRSKSEFESLTRENEDPNLSKKLYEKGLSGEALSAATVRDVEYPPVRFSQHIHMIETFALVEKQNEERRQRNAAVR